jgi:hypothetical protein
MPNQKSDQQKLTLEDLMRAESAVLDRIAGEVEGAPAGAIAHSSNASGHYSSSGHNSTVARVEGLDGADLKNPNSR